MDTIDVKHKDRFKRPFTDCSNIYNTRSRFKIKGGQKCFLTDKSDKNTKCKPHKENSDLAAEMWRKNPCGLKKCVMNNQCTENHFEVKTKTVCECVTKTNKSDDVCSCERECLYTSDSNTDFIKQRNCKKNFKKKSGPQVNTVDYPIEQLNTKKACVPIIKKKYNKQHIVDNAGLLEQPINKLVSKNNRSKNESSNKDLVNKRKRIILPMNSKKVVPHPKLNSGILISSRKNKKFTNVKSRVVKTTQKDVVSEHSAVTPIIKRLRQCEKKNYLEISDESASDKSISNVNKTKVPVYKQISVQHIDEQKDPYELDISDSELDHMKKNRILRKPPSEKFDKTMHEIIKKLEKNEKLKKRKVVNYQKNINSVLQRVMNKVKKKTEKTDGEPTSCSQKVQIKPHTQNLIINPEQKQTKLSNISLTSEVQQNISARYTEEFANCDDSVVNFPTLSLSFANDLESDRSGSPHNDISGDELSDFEDSYAPTALLHKRPNVNVISNILINSPGSLINKVNVQSPSKVNSPWRINNLINKKYGVDYKKNSLPRLMQDAVIDYNLAGRLEESLQNQSLNNKSIQQTPKKTIQTSISNFVNFSHNQSSIDVENIPENAFYPSLYGIEEFEISQPARFSNKRSVLGVISQNVMNSNCAVSTPIRRNEIIAMPSPNISVIANKLQIEDSQTPNISQNSKEDKSKSYFGFSNVNSDDNEQHDLNAIKPFRISMGIIKNYKKAAKKQQVSEEDCAEDLPSVLISNQNIENANEGGMIFEDVEPELLINKDEPIRYKKRGRRVRVDSINSNCSDEEKPKKKKKNAMTKAEEEEFEKWAAQFNAMCDEVDKHNLEIE